MVLIVFKFTAESLDLSNKRYQSSELDVLFRKTSRCSDDCIV